MLDPNYFWFVLLFRHISVLWGSWRWEPREWGTSNQVFAGFSLSWYFVICAIFVFAVFLYWQGQVILRYVVSPCLHIPLYLRLRGVCFYCNRDDSARPLMTHSSMDFVIRSKTHNQGSGNRFPRLATASHDVIEFPPPIWTSMCVCVFSHCCIFDTFCFYQLVQVW